jgi:exodeoxyribonuclease V alpha subunit
VALLIDVQFTAEQLRAVELALCEPVSILTGGPGTGKTTVCRKIVEEFRAARKRVLCAAPTGKASRRLQEQTGFASTIHRLLEWSHQESGFTRDNMNPLQADAVIVDEASMIDVVLMASLLDAIATGTHLIVVGDADQLPPVGPGSVLRDMIASGIIPVTRLTVVQRFKESERLKVNAHRIVKGDALYLDRHNNDDFFFMEREDLQQAADTIVNLVTKIIPRRHQFDPVNDVQVLCPMKKGILGVHNLNELLRERLNPEEYGMPVAKVSTYNVDKDVSTIRTFRMGDKVMQMRNNYKIGVFNGEVGRITAIDTGKLTTVTFDEQDKFYDFHALKELQLCYASTVHKSQGSEYPCVILVMHNTHWNMLFRALLYTGVTRAKKVVYIVGNKRGLYQALSNDRPVLRRTSLTERLLEGAS